MSAGRKYSATKQGRLLIATGLLAGMIGVGLVGMLDWSTGNELSLSILYLLPIGLAGWFSGKWAGAGVSLVAAAVWLWLDVHGGAVYSRAFVPYWNASVRLGFFLVTTFLLDRVRYLTGNLEATVKARTASLVTEVTLRKQAEESVRESELRFRQLAENIEEVFWISNPAKNEMIYISPAYEAIWGQSCKSLYASPRDWLDAIHSEDRDRVLAAALTKQVYGQYAEVYRIVRPDGSLRWIQDRAFPVRDESGKVYRIVGIAEDITERREAELELATLAQALESTAEIICITDLQDRFTYVNQAFQKAYGYTEQEILGKTPEILYSPNNPPSLMAEILAQTRLGGWRGEVLDRRKDGTEFPIFLGTAQIKDRSGQVIGLIGVSQDITERKRNEIALRELASIVENAEDAIISETCDGRIVSWNQGAERLFGYTAEEIKGGPISLLLPPGRPADLPPVQSRFEQGEQTDSFETARLRKDGTLVDVSMTASPIRDAAGNITGSSIIAHDITVRKQLEREIAEISHQEQERVAHELHDHLGAYLGGLAFRAKTLAEKLVRREVPEAADAQHLVELVNVASRQVRELSRWLALEDGASDGLALGLSRLGAEMETLFGITCLVEIAPNLPHVTPEQGRQLYRIAQEAARNASQHGQARLVEISLRHERDALELIIRNNGRPWTPSKDGSRGLGLRIMHYRARMLGGTFSIQTEPDGKSAVFCRVPLNLAAASQLRTNASGI